jgi:host factor-I protein
MDGDKGDLQNTFFNAARKERTVVAVFLGNGKKLVGRIKSFDKFTILLENQQGEQIVYKHAISTVGPWSPPQHRPQGQGGRQDSR